VYFTSLSAFVGAYYGKVKRDLLHSQKRPITKPKETYRVTARSCDLSQPCVRVSVSVCVCVSTSVSVFVSVSMPVSVSVSVSVSLSLSQMQRAVFMLCQGVFAADL
jgi:hypothetical protein